MIPARILIVEDEAILADDLQYQLSHLGYEVAGVTGKGEDAVRLAAELRPDLVLMDVRLAGSMDGVTAAGYVQLQNGPPVVFLTAHADDETLARARLTEPVGYLHKPVQERDLRTAVEMALYRHRVERQLRQSEELHRAALSSIGEGVISTDAQGRIALMNPEAERLTGWSIEEAAGRPIASVLAFAEEGTGRPVPCPAEEALSRQSVVRLPPRTVLLCRDGREVPVEDEAAPIDAVGRFDGGGAVVTFRDVTDLRRAEAALLRGQKREALGVLAAGIAHDFNNLLTPVLGYADLLAGRLAADPEATEMLREVRAAASEAARLTQQLLAYAGEGKLAVAPIDVSALVREMMVLVHANATKKASYHLDLAFEPMVTDADGAQLRQVILNLLLNASEAIGEAGGAVVVRTRAVAATPDELACGVLEQAPPAGEYVVLEVSDTGCGMTDGTLGRIFDPFFTTKFQGRGLGLSAVLGIVRSHGGTLTVTSQVGEGTTFRVYLPRSSRQPARPATPAQEQTSAAGGTVLIADDDPLVRTLADRLLRHAGLHTILVSDGLEAVETFRQRRGEIDVVLLDVTMPRLGGLEALDELRRLDPGVRVVLMSGYSPDDVAGRLSGRPPAGILQKPFGPGSLTAMVRRALSAVRPG